MDMSEFRTEAHVAQQSRRERLRVQQSSASLLNLEGRFSGNVDTPNSVDVREVRNANLFCNPNVVSSGVINLMNTSGMVGGSSFGNPSQAASTRFSRAFDDSAKQQESTWTELNCANASLDCRGNQNPSFIGVLSNNSRIDGTSCQPTVGTSYNEMYPNCQSSRMSNQYSHGKYEEMHLHNFQDVVTRKETRELDMASLGQRGGGELALVPIYGNTSSSLNFDGSSNWMVSGENDNGVQWSGEFVSNAAKRSDGDLETVVNDSTITQGLSLSLYSNNLSLETQPGELPLSGNLCSSMKPSMISKASGGGSLQDILGNSSHCIPQSSGPLGPFTGYATILKSSKFLKPAQQLLDEFCNVSGSKGIKMCNSSERFSSLTCNPGEVTEADKSDQVVSKSGKSAVLLPSSYNCGGESGAGSCSSEPYPPGFHHRKARLIYMQEEVRRRYKQYHQQMQMVVSSFESVAGLSSATPYISMALKTISRHFRSLKSGISDQLSYITKALGENLFSPITGVTKSGSNAETLRLNYMDRTIQKQKSSGGNVGSFEAQHIWRPQRGLPDRAVVILRTWLFDHFLHPYPTDTDKQILAAQTGLSRNQVSNWFINARVRIWKPMVEEVHMLETKNSVETHQSCGKNEEKCATEGSSRAFGQHLDSYASTLSYKQVEPHIIGSSTSLRGRINVDELNTENCSKLDAQTKSSIDGSIGFVPYQQGEHSSRGHRTVSLTLGPSHGVENAQQQQLFQQDDELQQQFEGKMLRDFVG